MKHIDEIVDPEEVSIDSFEVKDELNPRFWDEDQQLDIHLRRALLVIARDFIDEYSLNEYPITDIIMTGSLANYNWDEDYSDIDLHIVMDTAFINKDSELVKSLLNAARSSWNKTHTDISVGGFPVEIYIQDTHEPHKSSGVYSLLDGKWLKKPSLDNFEEDLEFDDIQEAAAEFMNKIDDLINQEHDLEYSDLYKKCQALMDEIKEVRANSLKKDKSSEYSEGNLIFKILRRTDYIERLINFKRKCFDKSHSIK